MIDSKVASLKLKTQVFGNDLLITKKGEKIECQLVGLTAGVHPNIDFLKGTALEIGRGIKVNKYLETKKGDKLELEEMEHFVGFLLGM